MVKRLSLVALVGTLVACGQHTRSASGRVVFALTKLDGKRLPTAYSDPRGRYTLRAGRLTLDPNGDLWFETDLIPDPDSLGGHFSRSTFVGTYARVSDDSLVFPAAGGSTPEFFGRLDGAGGLRLVAHPLPRASGGPSAISVAAQHGGSHVWEFHVR